jgi:hypothetical protein
LELPVRPDRLHLSGVVAEAVPLTELADTGRRAKRPGAAIRDRSGPGRGCGLIAWCSLPPPVVPATGKAVRDDRASQRQLVFETAVVDEQRPYGRPRVAAAERDRLIGSGFQIGQGFACRCRRRLGVHFCRQFPFRDASASHHRIDESSLLFLFRSHAQPVQNEAISVLEPEPGAAVGAGLVLVLQVQPRLQADDLIQIFGDVDVDSLMHRMRCENGDHGPLDVRAFSPSGSEAVGLRIRRLVAIKLKRVPVWREE